MSQATEAVDGYYEQLTGNPTNRGHSDTNQELAPHYGTS
jgi:hypothetical protein